MKLKQITSRVVPIAKYSTKHKVPANNKDFNWRPYLSNKIISYSHLNNFTFLNLSYSFSHQINWDFSEYGKLWAYNLNYFDFLNQDDLTINRSSFLLNDYVLQLPNLKIGLEPYPTSLRVINWIKFLAKNPKIKSKKIVESLFHQSILLSKSLEYHILGNHLLENGFALLFAAYYFKDQNLYATSYRILREELNEQILNDGAHFELSPMYHNIILQRILESIDMLRLNTWKSDDLLLILEVKASQMISWLRNIKFSNGDLPMVNDSAYGIAKTSQELIDYSKYLNIGSASIPLLESGYRMLRSRFYELFVDIGTIKSNYQPGHTHSDIFNFLLYCKGKPVVVDTGTSTYDNSPRRATERKSISHNTVSVENIEPLEVWHSFRVGKRAKVKIHIDNKNRIKASHNGFLKFGITHFRSFIIDKNEINITDTLQNNKLKIATKRIHLHPSFSNVNIFKESECFRIELENINIHLFGDIIDVHSREYLFAEGFNKLTKSNVIEVRFKKDLNTRITI